MDHIEEDRKARYLDWLYDRSGRTNGLYTGLYLERIAELVQQDKQQALDGDAQ